MCEPKSAYDLSEVANIRARHSNCCLGCLTRKAVDRYRADVRQSAVEVQELRKKLLCVVANCEICGGTGHQEGSEYPGSGPCDLCAAALKLLAKHEKESKQ